MIVTILSSWAIFFVESESFLFYTFISWYRAHWVGDIMVYLQGARYTLPKGDDAECRNII